MDGEQAVKYGEARTPLHLDQNPFTSSLDELIKHHANVVQSKSAYIESEKFSSMACTQFQAD
ncbi:hypothetical protein GCM10025794_30590 [Massilia kyonggiensis]